MAAENDYQHSDGGDLRSALEEVGQYDEVPNPVRGCGDLDHDSVYLRSDVSAFASADGEIPAFVTFDRPIPYREGHFRTFKRVNGTEFLLDATKHVTEQPEGEADAHRERVVNDIPAPVEMPEDEVLEYIKRVNSDATPEDEEADFLSSPFLDAMNSMDLLMWVGQSYYETPEEFINEARTMGVSKKIPVTGAQAPPKIRPFRTRLFLIHPRAIGTGVDEDGNELDIDPDDDDKADWDDQEFIPGIVGYSYLTRSVVTEQADGGYAKWAKRYEDQGLLNRVKIGEKIEKDDPDHPYNVDDEAEAADGGDAAPEAVEAERIEEMDDEEFTDLMSAEDDALADRSWSAEIQPIVDDVSENYDGTLEEWFRDEELSGMNFHDLRPLASALGFGRELGSNPSGDELRAALGAIPVYEGSDGDLRVDVDGSSYRVDEFEDVDKVARSHVKMAAVAALNAVRGE